MSALGISHVDTCLERGLYAHRSPPLWLLHG